MVSSFPINSSTPAYHKPLKEKEPEILAKKTPNSPSNLSASLKEEAPILLANTSICLYLPNTHPISKSQAHT